MSPIIVWKWMKTTESDPQLLLLIRQSVFSWKVSLKTCWPFGSYSFRSLSNRLFSSCPWSATQDVNSGTDNKRSKGIWFVSDQYCDSWSPCLHCRPNCFCRREIILKNQDLSVIASNESDPGTLDMGCAIRFTRVTWILQVFIICICVRQI